MLRGMGWSNPDLIVNLELKRFRTIFRYFSWFRIVDIALTFDGDGHDPDDDPFVQA